MNGFEVLWLLILISSLPVLAVYIWMRKRGYPITLPWILASLLSGVIALFLAALMQNCFPPDTRSGLGSLFVKIFIQIALTEELGRLGVLCILLWLFRRAAKADQVSPSFGASAGLLAGLGFAVVETAFYGAADVGIALIRAVTAAPLHGACGARVGMAAAGLRREPLRALPRFLTAVAVHGMYNLMIVSPGIPAAFSILIAFAALLSALRAIRTGPDPAPGAGQ
jgi:RsiW-degrading membrane proteinase PrsW (M82 family)